MTLITLPSEVVLTCVIVVEIGDEATVVLLCLSVGWSSDINNDAFGCDEDANDERTTRNIFCELIMINTSSNEFV